MSSSNGFQRVVNNQPGLAAAGDFADANIKANVIAGAGAFVTAPYPRSPIVGNFAWGDQDGHLALGQWRGEAAAKIGFVHRENNALITAFLAADVLAIAQGQIITLYDQGSFWARFAAGATVGQKVFANYVDGSVYADDAGTDTETADVTASLASTGILTVTAVGSGAISVGDVISGTGVPEGVIVTALLSGTGGVGTYQTTGASVVTSRNMFAHASVETSFFVDSPADAGELAKISTWG